MQPQGQQDYKQLLSQVIKKQIVILGPDITLAKARNVQGITISDDGTVTEISGDPQQLTQKLIDQFVQLSGEIVKKTMEPLLNMNQAPQPTPPSPTQTVTPALTPEVPTPQPIQSIPTQNQTPPPDASEAQAAINASLGTTGQSSQAPLPNAEQAGIAQPAKPVS